MRQTEVQRLEVLRRVQHEGLSQSQAARQLGLSTFATQQDEGYAE